MPTILYVQPVAERGGSDHALLRMIRSLPRPEVEAHVVMPGRSPMAEEFEAAGARLHVVPMRRITTSGGLGYWVAYALLWPVAVVRLALLARRVRADLVHTNSLHSWYGWATALLTRRPHVWHAREIVVQSRLALRVERFLTRRFASVVVAMSEAIAEQLDRRNVEVLWDTVDADEWSPANAGRFRPTLGLTRDVPLVGWAGRIDTWKGLDVLLDAWPLVRERNPHAELVVAGPVVAGKERYAEMLRRQAAELDGVHWLGARSDVADLMADLDVFVLPSTEPEPFGLVLIEALASGARAVATRPGGPVEIAQRAEPGAVTLVPARDAAALADAIADTLDIVDRTTRASLWNVPPADFAGLYRRVLDQGR
jgi:glycosyltransferase involved in cell wall biosynthesis